MLVVGSGSGAKAVVYSFNNVALSDGGLLNGTIDIQFGGLFGYSLTTTGGSIPSLDTSYHYPGYPSSGVIPFGNPLVVKIFPDGPPPGTLVNFQSILQLTFSSDLTVAGPHTLLGGILGPSFECTGTFACAAGTPTPPVRYIAADTIIDVVGAAGPPAQTPLPAALPLFATGLGALGLMGWRRKRKARAAA